MIKYIDGWWTIDHDHISYWRPKENWLRQHVGEEGVDWKWTEAVFADTFTAPLIRPMRYGIKDKDKALIFALMWG